jgi:hypothetical protein
MSMRSINSTKNVQIQIQARSLKFDDEYDTSEFIKNSSGETGVDILAKGSLINNNSNLNLA